VTIDIIAINNPPVGEDDFYEMSSTDGSLNVSAPGVLENDFDPAEFDVVHVHGLVTPPAFGEVDLQSDGSFTYTPDPGYTGFDGFSYRPADGGGPGNVTNVGILIN
jgi:hypothetical protein